MSLTTILPIAAALGLSAGGLVLAHRAWAARRRAAAGVAGAIALWAASTAIWAETFGAEIGIALALETGALVAFAGILMRAERRPDRDRKERVLTPPPAEPGARWRGLARFMVSGPLAFAAAMAVSVLMATSAPTDPQTRLVIAGLSVPTLWAILMLYSMAEKRMLRSSMYMSIIIAGVTAYSLLPKDPT
ncbi:hypothetical protein [Gimibacter soli]|uniref:Uncharacterized protein n=1 Tax=Gimibacter soli TaxID=3024400 RepID=A0AAF0BM60_9PROT|nr:hypothetical protein [Gimibacter soli]WCL54120.1 hypothetical protein PH603_16400 [Gimibacter soli]